MTVSRNSPCACGSGLRLKNCCGKIDAPDWTNEAPGRISGSLLDSEHRHLIENEPVCEFDGANPPPGLLIRWLSDDYDWKTIAARVSSAYLDQAAGLYPDSEPAVDAQTRRTGTINPRSRRTGIVDPGESWGPVCDMVRRAYRDEVEPFFDRRLRWFEAPGILRYTSGGFYRPHSDSDHWIEKASAWKRVLDRHLSLLIYLDNDYIGGQLVFPNFDYRLQPRAGMLMAFPSDHRYLHGAMPVLAGTRHAVVSWSAVEGKKLLDREKPSYALPR